MSGHRRAGSFRSVAEDARESGAMLRSGVFAALAFVGGLAVGALAWTAYQDRHASALFSPRARRRAAALSRLRSGAAGAATVDTVLTLREYVAWEQHPLLRERGKRLLARLASTVS